MTTRKVWEPDWRVHPGESVRESRETAGLSQKDAAARMGIKPPYLSDIERGRRSISVKTALRLEAMGWGPALFWLNLQTHFDLHLERERLHHGTRDER